MWKEITTISSILGILSVFILSGCGSAPSTGNTNQEKQVSKIFFTPASGLVNSGDTLVRTIEVENMDNTFYAAFDITYDPSVIEYVDSTEGTFLSRNRGDATSFKATLQNGVQGRVTVGLTRLGAIGDVSGSGKLLNLTFRAIGPGTTSLTFATPTGIKNIANQDVAVNSWEGSVITVQ